MGLRTLLSRMCLVAVFFITGISNLANLPLARTLFETELKAYGANAKAEDSVVVSLLLQNSFLIVAMWSGLAVVCSIATVLKVKWSAWVLILMLGVEISAAWYSPTGAAALFKALSMTGGLLIMITSVKSPARKAKATGSN